MILILGKNYII